MSLFLLLCTDREGATALRAATRGAHLAYLAAHADRVKLGGPWLDETEGAPRGSLLLVEAPDLAAARAFAASDPYAQAGLFAEVQIRPWRLVVGALG